MTPKINVKRVQRYWKLKFRDSFGIPWVSQQGRSAYLEKELVLG